MKKRTLLFSLLWSVSLQSGVEDLTDYLPKSMIILGGKAEHNRTTEEYRRAYAKQTRAVWGDVIEKLEEGLKLEKEIERAPEEAYFRADKASLRREMDEVFDEILQLLLDGDLFAYRERIAEIDEEIRSLQEKIVEYRERRISAPSESMLQTTREGYTRKIVDAQRAIGEYRQELAKIRTDLSRNLAAAGIVLSPGQIEVLLSRIDGEDILQMTMALEVLKQITAQLSEIMQESSHDLRHAKKYYGMYMVLVEMVAWVQERLIEKYRKEYLPKIDGIIARSDAMIRETKRRIAAETDERRRTIYRQNLRSQEYTKEIAIRYRKDLQAKLRQMLDAYRLTQRKVALAKNTYQTVMLSDELFGMMAESQKMFDEVMRLQIPQIVPFDSELLKAKYRELTTQMKTAEE